ncbi:MAG: eukaryotic-like serine/threonine-protein kinase [Frankiaceae bacterium]|nr:eukaryotic-like serine/threonine-protein kinase [Frankiaceae bacterium]
MDITTADPLIGQLFDGRYRVDARVARGGMATVYTGFDTRLDRIVAIKVMHQSLAEDEAFVGRFHREAKAAARLSHPNVVAIYDQGADAGRVFLVMEHVDGGTLRERLRTEGRLSPAAALGIMEPVLQALAAAHDAGLVHRDVKPENILISSDGRVKVADFGLARAVETTGMTTTGLLIGTVSYLAPEQVETGRADPRSDVYSAGIVLFELLTGAPPYDGDTPLSVAYRHVNDTVPAPSTILAGVPPALDEVVLRATQRDPDARPSTARDLLVGVRRAQQAVAAAGGTRALRPAPDALTLITPLPGSGRGGTHTRVLRAPGGRPPVVTAVRRRRSRRGPIAAAIIALLLIAAMVVGWQLGLPHKSSKSGAPSQKTPTEAASSTAPVLVPISTPDVYNKSFDLAKQMLIGQGFADVKTADPLFDDKVPAGSVLNQSPPPRTEAHKGDVATVVLSKGMDVVAVPRLVDQPQTAAIAALNAADLRPGVITPKYDEKVAKDAVISASQQFGAKIKRGTAVALVVSKGRQPIPVPAVTGKTYDVASAALSKVALKPVRTSVNSETVPTGIVISQIPATGTLFRGDTVTLTVSKGPAPVPMPDVVGFSRNAAVKKLQSLGLNVRLIDFPGLRGKTVFRQYPGPGTLVPKGGTVDIYMV